MKSEYTEYFWEKFEEFAKDKEFDDGKLEIKTTKKANSYRVATGFHPSHITIKTDGKERGDCSLKCQIRFSKDDEEQKKLWELLQKNMEQVRAELGLNEILEWREDECIKRAPMDGPTIILSRWVYKLEDIEEQKREEYNSWIFKHAELLIQVIRKYHNKI